MPLKNLGVKAVSNSLLLPFFFLVISLACTQIAVSAAPIFPFGVLGRSSAGFPVGTRLIVHQQDSNCNEFIGIMEALQFMETDIVAIIGPQSSVVAHVITHVANELKVPLLSFAATDPTLSSLQYPFFVRTTQSDAFQMAAIAELVDYFQWRKVIVIFIDDDYGRNGVAALSDKLAERCSKISYKVALPPMILL